MAFCDWKLENISISDEFLEGRNKYLLILHLTELHNEGELADG